MHDLNAVIIGSGVGGLATAIRLAVQGYKVTVFEKNTYVGGKVAAFEQDGYSFDSGPSLFTQPSNIEELFELANVPIHNAFKWQPLDISCKYFYQNGKSLPAYTNSGQFSEAVKEQLGEDTTAVKHYLAQSKKMYEHIGEVFLNNSLHKRKTWLHKRVVRAIGTVRLKHLFNTLHEFNNRQFKSPEAVQLFNRFATYNGSNPYKSPAMLSMVPHLELNEGAFYPQGGMISIANALYNLAKEKGITFYFESAVQRIIHHEGTVRGVVVNNKNIPADIVVSNMDVYFTYKDLLNDHNGAKKLLKQERSSSAIIFYWGIKREFKQLELHNIFFSKDYRKEFDSIFKFKQPATDPTIYINITSKMENSHAPSGGENWFVMVNAPANTGQNWSSIKERLRTTIITKLSEMLGEDIAELIETEQSADPVSLEEQTGSYMGSLYGTSSNSKMAAFFRHPNFSSTISGLYFCGGSVHPGGGIPLCFKSAKIVSDLVQQDRKHHRDH